jgi:hypothetical protein
MIREEVFELIENGKDTAFSLKEVFKKNTFFTIQDVNEYINKTAHANYISVIKNEEVISYGTSVDRYLDTNSLVNDIQSGYTFVLSHMQRYNKEIFTISNTMSLLFDRYVTTNIYGGITAAAKSHEIHADSQYVLILQLTGYSNWHIFGEQWDGSPENVILRDEEGLTRIVDVVLGPGDVAYIPYRRYHRCIPLSGRLSLSVSVDDAARPSGYGDWYSLTSDEFLK